MRSIVNHWSTKGNVEKFRIISMFNISLFCVLPSSTLPRSLKSPAVRTAASLKSRTQSLLMRQSTDVRWRETSPAARLKWTVRARFSEIYPVVLCDKSRPIWIFPCVQYSWKLQIYGIVLLCRDSTIVLGTGFLLSVLKLNILKVHYSNQCFWSKKL